MKCALEGRIVPMLGEAIPSGSVYIEDSSIVAVTGKGADPPAGFEQVTPVVTGGTIYPGLVELHNHLSYNALPMWQAPEAYGNRDGWQNGPDYGLYFSGPMKVLGTLPPYPQAVVRYAECKCLVSGVTTTQGFKLFSAPGIPAYYAGVVRNVESPRDLAVPAWSGHIGDVKKGEAEAFLAELEHGRHILHLAEGTDSAAHAHFEALQIDAARWAINQNLINIHCVALAAEDFAVLAERGSSMVWSPLSNILLYGQTADVAQAKAKKVPIALGSDWSPSGSKNLLHELKIAKIVSERDGIFSDRELVEMVTTTPAKILGWDGVVGALSKQHRADILVINGEGGDPYGHLLKAQETAISLVMIDGVARYGTETLMHSLAPAPQEELGAVKIGDEERLLDLRDPATPAIVAKLTLTDAAAQLSDALARLPELWKDVKKKPLTDLLAPAEPGQFMLVADNDPAVDANGEAAAFDIALLGGEVELQPMTLDPLCVTNDMNYFNNLRAQRNLPAWLAEALPD